MEEENVEKGVQAVNDKASFICKDTLWQFIYFQYTLMLFIGYNIQDVQ